MEPLTAMNAVEEIKQRLDIVEVISTYVPLKRAGRHFKGLCPFHTEKTPSFIVFPETGTWHCFGACGTGGDIFTFIMRRENLDFHEALELLARRAGVELMPVQPREAEAERRNERLRAICAAAAAYYHRLLLEHPQAAKARDHLAQRGIHEQTIRVFQLGYALDDWEAGQRHLLDLGYALADIVEAGLAVERQGGGSYYDRFRGRLIIPICDVQGRVVGFGARALDDTLPKYLNSPQTPIFDKGHIVFGLDKARQAIRAADRAVIVEGYMDVITAHQYGYTNVVASMGTALTEPQLRQLKRYTRNFTLALDPDVAGQQATLRGLEQARQALDREMVPVLTPAGLVRHERRLEAELRILSLPGAQDPDEVIRSNPQRWPELVEQALPIVDFYLARALETHDLNSAHGKAAIVAEIVPLIRELADDVMRHHYVQLLARRVQVDERIIERQLAKRENEKPGAPRPSISVEPAWRIDLEDYCLARILAQPEVLPLAAAELTQVSLAPLEMNDYERAENREIFARLQAAGDNPDMAAFSRQIPAALQPHWAKLTEAIARTPTLPPEQAARDLVSAILSLRAARIRRSLDELQRLLAEAQAAGDLEAARAYAQMVHTHTQERRRLDAIRHRRTMVGKRA